MKFKLPALALALAAGSFAAPTHAQLPIQGRDKQVENAAPQTIKPEPPLRTLTMNIEVGQGENGKPVGGLQQTDFTILDDRKPVSIEKFQPISAGQEPVEGILVVDSVNVDHTEVAYAVDQVKKFLRSNGGKLPIPMRLVLFSDYGTQIQPGFSRDGNAMADLLEKQNFALRNVRRSAGFWGGDERLGMSLNTLNQIVALSSKLPGRKMIFWVSPGWPLFSGPAIQLSMSDERRIFSEAVRFTTDMQRNNITIYGIDPLGTQDAGARAQYYEAFENQAKDPGKVQIANVGLQVLAFESGGMELNSSNDVAGEIQRALNDLTTYYQVTIPLAKGDHPDTLHKLKVQVDKPGLRARAWQGYYAQP